jgi:predicted dehydrogenase
MIATAGDPAGAPSDGGPGGPPARALRVGLVGCGRLAEIAYLPALRELEGLHLTALADPDSERARLLALRAGGTPRAFVGIEQMLATMALDAVLIASPVETHLRAARACADAGLPALVEKPPARDAAGAALLAELEPAPWVGFNRRFTHGRKLLATALGDGPLELEISISYRRRSWRSLGDLGDALLDLGPHAIDLSLLVCGHGGEAEVEVIESELAPSAARFTIACGRWRSRVELAVDRPHRERYLVCDDSGQTLVESREGGLRDALRARLRPAEHPLLRSIREQLVAFAAAAAGEEAPLLATAADGERVMRVVDRVRGGAGNPAG